MRSWHPNIGIKAVPNAITGRVEVPPTFFPIVQYDATNDQFAETVFTLPATDGASFVHTVSFSRLHGQPTRWKVGGTDILNRCDNGRCFGPNEHWFVDRGLASEFIHNPTMGGAGVEHFLLTNTAEYQRILLWSPLVHAFAQQNGNQLICEGCAIPLEFDTAGNFGNAMGSETTDVTTLDRDTLALFWRCRQFFRMHFNWRPDVHRVTTWFYSPVPYEQIGTGLGAFDVNHLVTSFTDLFFQNAGFYDMASRTLSLLDDATWLNQDNQVIACTPTTLQRTGAINDIQASPVPSGYTGGLMASAVSPCTLGIAQRLFRGDDRCDRPTKMELFQQRNPAHPAAGVDTASGQGISTSSNSSIARRAGWIGAEQFYVTSPSSVAALAAMDGLYRSGAMNLVPDLQRLPHHVRDVLPIAGILPDA
jgi:hypothetical protein